MVTVSTTQIYAFNGSLVDLLGLSVAPSFTRLNGEIVDSNGVLTPTDDTTISINGGPSQDLNFESAGTVSAVLGLAGTREIAVFTVPGSPGTTYLYAPDGLPTFLGATLVYTYDLDQTSFPLPTTTPGVVDGTDGDDNMDVGYVDADGDRITNASLFGNGNDVIDGKGGNDSIRAGSGNDSVLGGEGNDTLIGESGNDMLRGGNGDDLIRGGTGSDRLDGGAGSDTVDYSDTGSNISVNLATNTVSGGTAQGDTISGFENIIGGSGSDTLTLSNISGSVIGGAGNDSIVGGTGDDTLDGGAGNDIIRGGAGNDVFLDGGGTGNDTVFGGDGDDIWRAGETNSGTDSVNLEGGNDYAEIGFFSNGIPDTLDGGAGQDTVAFDAPIIGGNPGIILNDDGTSTTFDFGTIVRNFEHVRGNAANNAITGNNLDNELVGLAGSDTLSGGGGNDTLDGGADNDTLTGGTGNDSLTGGTGADRFIYAPGDGLDTITDFNQNDETLGDEITTNNDFINLVPYYENLVELRADFADDGILNQSNTDKEDFEPGGGIVFTGINAGNVKQLLTTETTGVLCFARGTLIETSTGQVAIETLKAGDLVQTMDRGFQPLRWIGSRLLDSIDLHQHPNLLPIRIRAGALGEGLPLADLTVSPQHRILVRSKIAKRMFGAHEILIPAKKLLVIEGIEVDESATSVEYFHMLFDQHEIVFSNGSATESLFTGPEAMRSLTEESKREVFMLFPALEDPAFVSEPARLLPEKGKMMKKLADRHQQNGAPIFK